MDCEYCGMEIRKGERFVCAGEYPSWWKIVSASNVGPGFFGRIYHEPCYVKMVSKPEADEKEDSAPTPPRKIQQKPQERPSGKRLVR